MSSSTFMRPMTTKLSGIVRCHAAPTYTRLRSVRGLSSYIISPKELSEALSTQQNSSSRIVPLCAAWFLPNDPQKRTGRQVFEQRRLPAARFFDLDAVKDPESPYPHMLPSAEGFAAAMSELGIRKDDRLVVYDTHELGIFSAPRVAWTLRVFGHPAVHVLNNFRLWIEQGYPTESGISSATAREAKYPIPDLRPDAVTSFREIKAIVKEKASTGGAAEQTQIIDARSSGRFNGTEPEPRPGLSSGHMPNSISLPLPDILDPQSKAFLPAEDLRRIFEGKGINPDLPIITTCGTGVMAAALEAALAEASFGKPEDRRVYDGSWTEYAQRAAGVDGLIEKTA